MREKGRIFGKRSTYENKKEPKNKYFLFFEGEKTEHIYFDSINKFKNQVKINPLIEIIPMLRSYSEKGLSNPQKILDKVIDIVNQNKLGYITYDTLINKIMDYFDTSKLYTFHNISKDDVLRHLNGICKNHGMLNKNEKATTIEAIYNDVLEKYNFIDSSDFFEFMNIPNISYEETYDKICLIVDRDKSSFKKHQYENVRKLCKDNKFDLYITNPCFEFWLLLHFDEIKKMDKIKLLENKIPKGRKKSYIEEKLTTFLNSYNKNRYNAELLVNNIDKAIENEKLFCEDINDLERQLGSNIGRLICKMRDKKQ